MFKIFLAATFLFSQIAFAEQPLQAKGQAASTFNKTLQIEAPNSQITKTADKKMLIETGNNNIVTNPGFEGPESAWSTPSGTTASTITSAANTFFSGKQSWKISLATSTAGDLVSPAYTVPQGLAGKDCELSYMYAGSGSDRSATLVVYDGANNQLATYAYTTVTPTDGTNMQTKVLTVPFLCPATVTSTTVYYKLTFTSVSLVMNHYIDDVYIGPNRNIGTVAQGAFLGSKTYTPTSSCVWQTTSSSQASFAADSDCATPTITPLVGAGITGSSKDLKVTVTNGQPGIYFVTAVFSTYHSSTDDEKFSLYDGTTQKGDEIVSTGASSNKVVTLHAAYEYTGSPTVTFEIRGATPTGTINLRGDAASAPVISVTRFPLGSENGLRLNALPSTTTPVAYTPTFTGFGTVSGVNFKSWKDGAFLYVIGSFTAGTNTATEARITLGFNGTSANVTSVSTGATLEKAGDMSGGTPSATWFGSQDILIEPSVTYMTVGIHSSTGSGLSKVNGNALTSSVLYSVVGKFQISGWTSPSVDMPLVRFSRVTPYAGVDNYVAGLVTCSAASTVTPTTSGITAGNRSTTSCALTVAAGTFSSAPWDCHVTINSTTVQAANCVCSSATACTVYGPNADYVGYVGIAGPK